MTTSRRLDAIQTFCDRQAAWTAETVEGLTRLESPTTDKAAVDRCGHELANRLQRLGASVTRLPHEMAGDHILAEMGEGPARILLLGHFDTVWPVGQLARMPLERKGDRLFGPGVFDMKGGITIAMLAVRALFEAGPPPACRLAMLWTSDEETGSVASEASILEQAGQSDAVLVLEPSGPQGALKTSRKGCGQFEMVVTGVAAHAGIEPERGCSAVHELARQIVGLESLHDSESGITVNVGQVRGGTHANVVAAEARAMIDIRVETLKNADRLQRVMETRTSVDDRARVRTTGHFRPPLERTAAVVRLYEIARAVASELGHDLGEFATGGGSDGNLTAARGIATLDGLGAVGEGAHALHEQIDLSAVPWRAALLAGVIDRLAARGASLASH